MKPRYWLAAAGIIIAGVIAWRIYANTTMPAGAMRARMAMQTLTVDTVSASRRSIPLVYMTDGLARPHHSVTVRARVGGVIEKVLFEQGERVEEGQLLFVIEAKPYRIKLHRAQARVQKAEARLAADKAKAKRLKKLVGNQYVSPQDYKNAKAQVSQDKAMLAAARARLDKARLQIDYTKIRAPISGKAGAITYKEGNLIDGNGSTKLVTINQFQPIEVWFELPQSKLATLLKYRGKGELRVSVSDANGHLIANNGKLVFINNEINKKTGTLRVKALFPNRNRAIWPGQLLTVTLRFKVQDNALVIPMIAVQPGQEGTYVYAVEDGKIDVRQVEIKRQHQGLAVIEDGLKPGDDVVVRVPRRLEEGMSVKANPLTLAEALPDLERPVS